jgi:hypothetical protein
LAIDAGTIQDVDILDVDILDVDILDVYTLDVDTLDVDICCSPLARTSMASETTQITMNDKRGSPRQEVKRTVHMGSGLGPSLECELKDLSETGARLKFNDPKCAPQEFLIRLSSGVLKWCQVIWRSESEIGVKFIKTPKSFKLKAPPGTEAN